MSKSSISILAKAIANSKGLTEAEAERFIMQMFSVANDAIQDEKQLKVKWLGTFKVTAVKDRESVDVNTGERIVIEGRDKISFTPDNILKEIVNKPFAQFETVVVNDGVDFSDIDEKFANLPGIDEKLANLPDRAIQDSPLKNSAEKLSEETSKMQQKNTEAVIENAEKSSEVAIEHTEKSSEDVFESTEKSTEDELMVEQILESVPDSAIEHVVESTSGVVEDANKVRTDRILEAEDVDDDELEKIEIPRHISHSMEAVADNAGKSIEAESPIGVEDPVEDEKSIRVSNPIETKENNKDENESETQEITGVSDNGEVSEFANVSKNDRASEVVGDLEEDEESHQKHHFVIPMYVAIVACIVFVGMLGAVCWFAYNYGMMQAQQKNLQVQLADLKANSQKAAAQAAKRKAVVLDSTQLALREKARQDSLRMAAANNAINMAEKADSLRKAQEKLAAKDAQNVQDKGLVNKTKQGANAKQADEKLSQVRYDDPRVRTGAYRIVGVAQTITVQKGQSIQSITRRYLGPGMECYVEALNGCKEVRSGQKLKIPKVELKKKSK